MLAKRLTGIGVIAAAIVIVLLATLRPDPFKDTKSLYARFDSAQGIGSIDRNVRVGGTNAGQIGEVRREGDDVIVELDIDPEIRVADDAHASLRPHTLFEGSAFVDLSPGSPSAPELSEGDEIPKAHTDVYVSVDQAVRVLKTENREKLKNILNSTSKILRGEAVDSLNHSFAKAPELLKELGPTARALQGPGGDELSNAVIGLSRTVDAVASREQDLIPLAQRATRTATALAVDRGAALDAALAALPGPLQQLASNGRLLTGVVDRLDSLSVELQPAARALTPLLRESRPLLRRATPVTRQATPLVGELRTVLARVAEAAPAVERAVKTLRPGARILSDKVAPVLTSDGQVGVPVYAQLAAAFGGETAALRAYQTTAQGTTGAGHVLRLAMYGDPAALNNLPACSLIALISPSAAAQLDTIGLCRP